MASKYIISPFMKQHFLFLFLSLYLIKIGSSLFLTLTDIKKVCSNADQYINSYFSEDEELPAKYNEFTQSEIEKGDDENIIKLILLSENAEKEYENAKISKFNIYQLILSLLIIFFCIISIILEIHFLSRTSYMDNQIKNKNKITCITFIKINPFSFFKYLCMNKKQRSNYFIEYKSQKILYNKFSIIIVSIIIFILIITSIFLAIFIFYDKKKTQTSISNMACTLINFLYEIKNKPVRESSFIGFENLNNFFAGLNEFSKVINSKLSILTNNFEKCKTLNISWVSLVNEIQKKISDQDAMEFYLYGLPSDPNKLNFKNFSIMGDISKLNKHIFQLQEIYNYYPVDKNGKTLYDINKLFYDILEPIISELAKLDEKVSSQNSDNEENKNRDIYQNVVSKLNNVLNFYIEKFEDVFLEKTKKNLKNDLTIAYAFDLISLLLLILCIPLFIILVKNVYKKNFYSHNKIISILLMHINFMFFILSTYQLIAFNNSNKKIIYIQDIWSGVAFLFDSNNINYLNEHPINNIGYIDILIKENNKYNNLFSYLNYMVNNQGKINNNSRIQIVPFSKEELLSMNEVFNNLSNFLDSYDENNPNQYLYNYILKISDMIKEGLNYDTKFQDTSSSGFLNSNSEYPLAYLTYVNLRTRAVAREDPSWGFKDFDCDENWNISTSNYGLWTPNKYYTWYYTNSEKYLCNNCTNHYSSKNANNPPLLNYLEFTLEQAIERYSYLKDTENNDEYNGLVYYFTGVEF